MVSFQQVDIDTVKQELTANGLTVSQINRGIRRLGSVSNAPTGYDGWVVEGDAKLGDRYPGYQVIQLGTRFMCGCYVHNFGTHREKNSCSHTIAVYIAMRLGQVAMSLLPPEQILLVKPPEMVVDFEGASDVLSEHGVYDFTARPTALMPYPEVTDNLKPADLGFTNPKFAQGFRRQQIDALRRILTTDKKFIIIQAPPGVGKTLIAASIQRLTNEQTVYVCSNKDLQQQAYEDFAYVNGDQPFGKILQGKANYPTLLHEDEFPKINASQCVRTRKVQHCHLCCDGEVVDPQGGPNIRVGSCVFARYCPYQVAKYEAHQADFAILNTTMFLFGTRYGGMWNSRLIPWLVMDEADLAEKELLGHVKFEISKKWAEHLQLKPPKLSTVVESWVEWVSSEVRPTILEKLDELYPLLPADGDNDGWDLVDPWVMEQVDWLEKQLPKVDDFLESVSKEKWVWEGGDWEFKPVYVSNYGEPHYWSYARKVVLMSATIISPQVFARDLGIPPDQYEFIDLPCSFDKMRRLIRYEPTALNVHKNKENAIPQIANKVNQLVAQHPDQRVIVHTHSYALTKAVHDATLFPERMISYRNARERAPAIERYRATPGAILVGPSLERGLDLPDDLARALIVTKVPYANTQDKQVAARVWGGGNPGKRWYAVDTIRSLVQMVGRGVRHERDYCQIYILDMQFMELWKQWQYMFPEYFREAMFWPWDRKGVY